MASPVTMGMIGIGANVAGGIVKAQGAQVSARGQQLNIQGAILGTIGRAFQYDVESQEYTFKSEEEKYQGDVSRMNADVAKENANYELSKGEVGAEQAGMENRFALGTAKAAQGASGIDVSSASSGRVRESMIEIGSYNETLIRDNAARIAYGFEVQRSNFEAQAAIHDMQSGLDKAQAANADTAARLTRGGLPLEYEAYGLAGKAGQLGAEASLIGAAGSVAGKWQTGGFSGMNPSA